MEESFDILYVEAAMTDNIAGVGKMSEIEYIEEYGDYGIVNYRPLNPTGRWKIESGPYCRNMLYIEHKGVFFKSWISEYSISLRPKQESLIFECGK